MNLKGFIFGIIILGILTPFILYSFYYTLGDAYGQNQALNNPNLDNALNKSLTFGEDLSNAIGRTTGTGSIFDKIIGGTTAGILLFKDLPSIALDIFKAIGTAISSTTPPFVMTLVLILLVIGIGILIISIIMKWRFSDD